LIVVDASAILEVVLNTSTGNRVRQRLSERDATLHAPHLIDVEVAQVLRRYSLAGELNAARGEQALLDYTALSIERYRHVELVPRIWELRKSLTAYDAAYVVLAEALDSALVTCDSRLARSHGHDARIELIA
jgi:predicted nucleic acid-binding protein